GPPGTTRVCPRPCPSSAASASDRRPLEQRTAAPPGEGGTTRYPGATALHAARNTSAPENTSAGPVTSRLCTPSKRGTTTVRSPMPPILARPRGGGNVEHPTFPAIGPATAFHLARKPHKK